jgi:Fic family protein
VAIAALHHRLLWVHPFDDGNGRVARLVAHAQIVRAGLDAGGLWSISRGLARNRDRYRALLAAADAQRHGSTDGRGNLSERALTDFCVFFLSTMVDQTQFMRACLDFDTFTDRLRKHLHLSGAFGKTSDAVWRLLREAWLRGAYPRGEAATVLHTSERTARNMLKSVLESGLLTSETERGPVRLSFPPEFVEDLFPRLHAPGP